MRRFDAYSSALSVLELAHEQDLSNEFIQSGIIDKFAIQFELAWKMLKDLLRYEGDSVAASGSPRDVLKASHRLFDFIDEDIWLPMLHERNNIMHIYDADEAQRLLEAIIQRYIPAFVELRKAVLSRYGDELLDIA